MRRYNYLNKNLFVLIFSIPFLFLFLSCSDELQLDPASSDLSADATKDEDSESVNQEDSIADNENSYIYQNIESLDEAIDILEVSEEEKCYLKNFIKSIKEQLDLDDSIILDALSKGKETLEELGINNEDVIQFLFSLCLNAFIPGGSEIVMFLDILKALNLDSDNGNMDANKISSLLFSDNIKNFVEERFLSNDKLNILNKIAEYLSVLSSKN